MSASRPVRLVTMVWGDSYVGDLLEFTLPALLAPRNLPAVAERFDCRLVIVTEEARFGQLREHPVIRGIERHCPVELRPIDEFISRPDAYGMALTYAYFRGFKDLGEAMTKTQLIFFNSDFVMADGSLETVVKKILAGERLILAPSYCVVREKVVPALRLRRSPTGELALPPREMAELAIRHRHNTIRGKTVNQQAFSMEWIDQFYWLVDDKTLLAHQLPIAVVSLRPQRVLTEMRTFWDYGLLSEACPTASRCVLGDSDDFLWIELRSRDTSREQLALAWPSTEEIAARLQRFITRDPIELSRYPLLMHAADLPDVWRDAEKRLAAYVETVIRQMPGKPHDHIDHPIWMHHYKAFHEARANFLARRSQRTEA